MVKHVNRPEVITNKAVYALIRRVYEKINKGKCERR